jgi:hypothetical protein
MIAVGPLSFIVALGWHHELMYRFPYIDSVRRRLRLEDFRALHHARIIEPRVLIRGGFWDVGVRTWEVLGLGP